MISNLNHFNMEQFILFSSATIQQNNSFFWGCLQSILFWFSLFFFSIDTASYEEWEKYEVHVAWKNQWIWWNSMYPKTCSEKSEAYFYERSLSDVVHSNWLLYCLEIGIWRQKHKSIKIFALPLHKFDVDSVTLKLTIHVFCHKKGETGR